MKARDRSPWSVFRHRVFAVVWSATLVSNIGGWMYSAAAAWLMTSLDTNAFTVSLVQVATSLPLFLFALPAGALADIVDKRRFLIVVQIAVVVLSVVFASLVSLHRVDVWTLLIFMFAVGCGSALIAPAWQSIVPLLVPHEELPAAVDANSVGVNISRAVGPAISGLLTTAVGIAAPFWIDALSTLATIGALVWWQPPPRPPTRLPAEQLASAMRTGLRYARNNPSLRATLYRSIAFFLFASAYWALLPLVAHTQIAGGPEVYGLLLGAIGAGAIGGAFALPAMRARLGADRLALAGTVGTAAALLLFGATRGIATALLACAIAGVCWIATLSCLNVSAQISLPEWVRGRGLAIYVTVFFGAMTVGSALWGQVAAKAGLPIAHFVAAAGALLAIALTRRFRLQTAAGLDLTPSMHWPAPAVAQDLAPQAGPVMVTVAYRIAPADRSAFLSALGDLAAERRRDGAYAWGVFEDTATPGRLVETFLVESWLEHLRQHERVTNADRILQERVGRFLQEPETVTHLLAARADASMPASPKG